MYKLPIDPLAMSHHFSTFQKKLEGLVSQLSASKRNGIKLEDTTLGGIEDVSKQTLLGHQVATCLLMGMLQIAEDPVLMKEYELLFSEMGIDDPVKAVLSKAIREYQTQNIDAIERTGEITELLKFQSVYKSAEKFAAERWKIDQNKGYFKAVVPDMKALFCVINDQLALADTVTAEIIFADTTTKNLKLGTPQRIDNHLISRIMTELEIANKTGIAHSFIRTVGSKIEDGRLILLCNTYIQGERFFRVEIMRNNWEIGRQLMKNFIGPLLGYFNSPVPTNAKQYSDKTILRRYFKAFIKLQNYYLDNGVRLLDERQHRLLELSYLSLNNVKIAPREGHDNDPVTQILNMHKKYGEPRLNIDGKAITFL